MSHTVGPWQVVMDVGANWSIESDAADACICTDNYMGSDESENWANARLISAAPEMLSLLKRMAGEYTCTANSPHPDCVACELRRVLDLAEPPEEP